MKVVISATGKDLESTIDERFGRCRYFLIVETDDMSYDVVDNANADLSTSAGIQSASYVASTGAEAVITGNCGPKAMRVFAETKLQIILGQHGVIREVLQKFKSGALSPSAHENVPEKSGVSPTTSNLGGGQPGMGGGGRGMGGGGRGMGGGGRCMGGGGRGMGMSGGGRGMGMGGGGRGMGMNGGGMSVDSNRAGNLPKQQELDQLNQQAEALKEQMEAIQAKIRNLA